MAPTDPGQEPRRRFAQEVDHKARRKQRSREEGRRSPWFGLGMFGLVGWSVAIPTVLGVALGVWLDRTLDSTRSWTLMLLLVGVIAGCLNAWFWVQRESRDE